MTSLSWIMTNILHCCFFPLCVYPVCAWKKKIMWHITFSNRKDIFFCFQHDRQWNWTTNFKLTGAAIPLPPAKQATNIDRTSLSFIRVWDWERGQTRGPKNAWASHSFSFDIEEGWDDSKIYLVSSYGKQFKASLIIMTAGSYDYCDS